MIYNHCLCYVFWWAYLLLLQLKSFYFRNSILKKLEKKIIYTIFMQMFTYLLPVQCTLGNINKCFVKSTEVKLAALLYMLYKFKCCS